MNKKKKYLAISQMLTLTPRLGIQPMPLCGTLELQLDNQCTYGSSWTISKYRITESPCNYNKIGVVILLSECYQCYQEQTITILYLISLKILALPQNIRKSQGLHSLVLRTYLHTRELGKTASHCTHLIYFPRQEFCSYLMIINQFK